MTLTILALAAALTAGSNESAPKPEIGRVRFVSPNVVLSRTPPYGPTAFIGGAVIVSFGDFAKPSVHCPVLHMTCLCSIDGALTCYHGFWDKLKTYSKMKTSDVMDALKATGRKLSGSERKTAMSDPGVFTPFLPEVLRERLALTCTYGDPKVKNKGFFRLSQLTGPARLLLVHLEMWQNGVKIGEYESSHTGLGKYGLPSDWHVWKQHPQKIRYVDAF